MLKCPSRCAVSGCMTAQNPKEFCGMAMVVPLQSSVVHRGVYNQQCQYFFYDHA